MKARESFLSVSVAVLLCASMFLGLVALGTGHVRAADDATFVGTVTVGGFPAPDTLVMYTLNPDGTPSGNSTVTDLAGDYELWVEGGATYYLYYANGGAMFDTAAEANYFIDVGETVVADADLTPAPAQTVTLMGYVENASNPGEPVTSGHVLGLRMTGGEDPDYINWSAPDGLGYYEIMLIPGTVMPAIFDAEGYYPYMGGSGPLDLAPGESGWHNISLIPYGGETVNITGHVTDAGTSDPIANALIEVNLWPSFYYSTYTDSAGSYNLSTVEGQGEINVRASGYTPQRLYDVTFFTGNSTLDWTLYPLSARVSGYVVDSDTLAPIEGADVGASSNIGPSLEEYNYTTTDSDGYFDLNVSDGECNIWAQAPGYGGNGTDFFLYPYDWVSTEIRLTTESAVIKGFVTDELDNPVSGCIVRIKDENRRDNATYTDTSGYFEINCVPCAYMMMFFPSGYSWDWQMDYDTVVGQGETLWVNHTVMVPTTEVYGTVQDAATMAYLDDVEITIASQSIDPEFYHVAMITSSGGGLYDAWIVGSDAAIFSARLAGYGDYFDIIDVPESTVNEYNFYLVPDTLPSDTYFLEGYVTDQTSGDPISGAQVVAYSGFYSFNDTFTNSIGYYYMEVPCVVMDIAASAAFHLPSTVTQMPGAPDSTVPLDFALESHVVAPVVEGSVVPAENVSMMNPADIYAIVTEPYIQGFWMGIYGVVDRNDDYAYVMELDSWNANWWDGMWWSDLSVTYLGSDTWEIGLFDWDATSEDLVELTDDTGLELYTDTYSYDMDGTYYIWGYYQNATSPSSWCTAMFDPDGTIAGIDVGMGYDTYAAADPTGEFWMMYDIYQVELSSSNIIAPYWNETAHLNVTSMTLLTAATYASGEYLVYFNAQDIAWLGGSDHAWFTVDNEPPTADAGTDQSAIVNTTVTLDASGSSDKVGVASYSWEYDDGMGGTVVVDGMTADVVFDTVGDHEVTLYVVDGGGFTATDTVTVTATPDEVPLSDAGPDQSVDEDTVVSFDGAGSTDDLVVIANYTWTIVELDVEMYEVAPEYTFAEPGTYLVELVVEDTIGQVSLSDEMVVTVADVTDPTADAGVDQEVDMGTDVTLNASLSDDNVEVISWAWTFNDEGTQEFSTETVSYVFENAGVFTVTLRVEDAAGNYDTDTVVITVLDTEAPFADAGEDVDVVVGDAVTLDGTGSSDNVGIVSYTWTFTDVTSQILPGAEHVYTFENEGDFTITLTVVDDEGLSDIDEVVVHVLPENAAPTADAGDDQIVTEGDTVTLDGTGSTDDGGAEALNYTWTFEYDGETVTRYGAEVEFTFDIPGEYDVTLTVEDEDGLTSSDSVSITVEEKSATFIEQYWWALAALAAVVVVAAAIMLFMKKGKGGAPSKKAPKTDEDADDEMEDEDEPPAPPEEEEL